jgi:hypothetical protein
LGLGGTFHRRLELLLAMGEKGQVSFHSLDNQNHATCETDDIRINKEEHSIFVASLVAANLWHSGAEPNHATFETEDLSIMKPSQVDLQAITLHIAQKQLPAAS